jgi:hypothetical protein
MEKSAAALSSMESLRPGGFITAYCERGRKSQKPWGLN